MNREKIMERLTRRSANGTAIYATPNREPVKGEDNRHNVLQKLAYYEDLEESGNLFKLPCRLGDTVYILNQKRIIPLEICENYFDSHGIEMAAKNREELGYRTINLSEDGIGVEWYKTEEEVKAAMNKLKGKDKNDIERD